MARLKLIGVVLEKTGDRQVGESTISSFVIGEGDFEIGVQAWNNKATEMSNAIGKTVALSIEVKGNRGKEGGVFNNLDVKKVIVLDTVTATGEDEPF